MNNFNVRVPRAYIRWLQETVITEEVVFSDQYSGLLEELWDCNYDENHAYLVPNDDNRIADALHLRREFDINMIYEGPCTVLELLIGIAKRMSDFISISPSEDHTAELFWEFLANLKLTYFDDDVIDKGDRRREIRDILTVFRERLYGSDGVGGIFPLRNPPSNQAKTEIWYQMMAYLEENYPV